MASDIMRGQLKIDQRVRHIETGRTGTIREMRASFNRRGDPCQSIRVFWDDRKPSQRRLTTWIADYNLIDAGL